MKYLGRKIKEARIKKGLSQEELAEKLFITKQSISKYENNHAIPSKDILENIQRILEIKINEPRDAIENKILRYRIAFVILIMMILTISIYLGNRTIKITKAYDELVLANEKLVNDKTMLLEQKDSLSNNLNDLESQYQAVIIDYAAYESLLEDYESLQEVYNDLTEKRSLTYDGLILTYNDLYRLEDGYLYLDFIIHNTSDEAYSLSSDLFSIDTDPNIHIRVYDQSNDLGWGIKTIKPRQIYTCELRISFLQDTYLSDHDSIKLYFAGQFVTMIKSNEII